MSVTIVMRLYSRFVTKVRASYGQTLKAITGVAIGCLLSVSAYSYSTGIKGLDAYFHGDYETARMEFENDVRKTGNPMAALYLGNMHIQGKGVERDVAKGIKIIRIVAERGYSEAQFSLALMHEDGDGVPQDHLEAIKWYRLASAQGSAKALNNLGLLYGAGEGIRTDKVVSYALLNLSATYEPSNDAASKNRTRLLKTMTQPQLSLGQSLTRRMAKPGNFLRVLDDHLRNAAKQTKSRAD